MFNNYLKIAFRNIKRYKLFTFINISGLAVGITTFAIISLWVKNEISYDKFNTKADRIFRIEREITRDENDGRWPITGARYKQALIDDYPEVINAVRFWSRTFVIRDNKNELHRQNLFAADNSVFKIFDFVLLRGNKSTALSKPNTLVLTESSAIEYFGSSDVIGKTLDLELEGKYVKFEITGILKDIPKNSHIHFDMLISFTTFPEENFNDWRSNYLYTYILVKPHVQKGDLELKLNKGFIDKYLAPVYLDLLSKGKTINNVLKIHLFPITDIHLNPSENWELEPGGSRESVMIFSTVAVILLIIAGINFINLSTARAARRAKEVSLRKTVGAFKNQLIIQFLQESVLYSLFSGALSLIILLWLIPTLNSTFGLNLNITELWHFTNIVSFIGIVITIGLIAGIYPAFYLSKFDPVNTIKTKISSDNRKSTFRRNMVVLQFSISISLIIVMSVMFLQMKYIQSKSLGFDKEDVIISPIRGSGISQRIEVLKNKLLSNPKILSVAGSFDLPGDPVYSNGNLYLTDKSEKHFSSTFMQCDYDFIDTYKIPVIAGRNFSREYASDTSNVLGAIIVNEEAVKKTGYSPKEAIGKVLDRGDRKFSIIGVVKNFNFQSLLYNIEPMIFTLSPNYISAISIRLIPTNIPKTIEQIKTAWHDVFPNMQFEYSFLDKRIDQLYESEQNTKNLLILFTSLSILIASLGLFGLVAYTAEERTKEIGIRKTLGATVPGIFMMLTSDYLKWILISIIISYPVSFYLTNNWLNNFAYRINIEPAVFIFSAIITLFITLITVSYQTIKAAIANPVESLKYE